MAEETKTKNTYESKVLKRAKNVAFHTCKTSTYKARKFQVRIAKEYLTPLIADLPEDAQSLTKDIKEALETYGSFTGWATVEFMNSNNKLKDAWNYQASVLELVEYNYNGERGLTMNLCGKLRDVQSEQLSKRMRLLK